MAIKLMYITNKPSVAKIAENSGVDRIFIDLEYIGKEQRQPGMDTVKSHHTFEDITVIKNVLECSQLVVRCNCIHENTESEIEEIVKRQADIIMLPYFKTVEEVKCFLECVGGRVKTMLLVETPEAAENIDKILELDGIDEVYIGLNDLSLGYGKKFMFELLSDGTVEKLCEKFRKRNIPYGFGGIAAIGTGTLPAENILIEHYRLGSRCVILSRSFCNYEKINDEKEINEIFKKGVTDLRNAEKNINDNMYERNIETVRKCVQIIVNGQRERS